MARDLRPFHLTLAVLAANLAWTAWVGNRLWAWYTLLGLGVALAATGLARAGRLPLPPVAAWLLALALSLHYVGGSLSGLHQVGGPNGLYYAFPWWDNLVHALGAASVAIAAAAALLRVPGLARWQAVALAVALASTAGVLVELYEFANFLTLGTVDQGFYTNTVLDLYYNLVGATLGAAALAGLTRAGGA